MPLKSTHRKKKKIWLDPKRKYWCYVHLFKTKKLMQEYYKKRSPKDDVSNTLGVHLAYTWFKPKSKKVKGSKKRKDYDYYPKTGEVLLNLEYCGSGIVSHEFMHAVLWAWKHSEYKKQYPLVIKSMKQEEEILHNLTHAVRQFYTWYWKVKSKIK